MTGRADASQRAVIRAGWRQLAARARPYRRELLAVAGLSVLLAAPTAVSGRLIAHALDDGFLVRRPATGLFWLGVLAEAGLVSAVLGAALFRPLTRFVDPFRDRLIDEAVAAGLDRALARDAPSPGGDTLQATEWVETIRQLLASVLRNLHMTVSVAVGALLGLAALEPVAAAVVAPCLLASLAANWALLRRAVERQRRNIDVEEALADEVAAVFRARRDVIACAAEDAVRRDVARGIGAARDARVAAARIGVLRSLTTGLGAEASLLLLLALAPWLIAAGRLSGGEIVGAAFYVALSLGPALSFLVLGGTGWFVGLLGLLGRLDEALPRGPAAAVAAPSAPPLGPRPALAADDLTFAYSASADPVLAGVSVRIPFGAHVAVVGPSGSGKSTLASLLCGLRAPDRGRVSVAGRDLGDLPPALRHRTVSLIPQEAYVFAGTLRENLGYLLPGASNAALLDAADAFGLRPVLDRLGGLDAALPPGGAGLSAGERQLVALARTYLAGAPIAVLDEAACHLDPAAERAAEAVFARRGGTLIVIAHRIGSAVRADRVLLVDGGRIAEGTHEELLRTSPRYRELAGHWKEDHAEAPA
ncbi:ATP-binding cassette domain-containing protein [Actinomadura chibensis]|uniref:ABC transporter ATP-binding protein n=1 Tax=Actinomadura chibensis TaxID=392828 RepID=A0A5D0ND66_9ACTN|nr:ABC transporter ATP-binding protein [Actinomadura chibensis]TYB42171.1 ABC transporter ATP-binding protein [Actinomadura chibensis]